MSIMKKSYCIYVDKINQHAPGVSKLSDRMISTLGNAKVITSLDDTDDKTTVIPLGILASYAFLRKYKKGNLAFIIDATTLCFLSVIKFYISHNDFFNRQLIRSLLGYIKYYLIEKRVIKNFKKIIVVAEHDANYLKKKFKNLNVEVISNGIDIPDLSKSRDKKFDFTLGILSYWNVGSFEDVNWFITDYLPRLKKIYPNIKLITAGKGANSDILQFFEHNEIEHMGEIDNLWDFFNRIDIYITTLRKECGILNKVLDAMAHQKIVVGLEHNMYAFKNLKDGFFSYKNFEELTMVLETVKNNRDLVDHKVRNAYKYILTHHNWTNNYIELKSLIDNL